MEKFTIFLLCGFVPYVIFANIMFAIIWWYFRKDPWYVDNNIGAALIASIFWPITIVVIVLGAPFAIIHRYFFKKYT